MTETGYLKFCAKSSGFILVNVNHIHRKNIFSAIFNVVRESFPHPNVVDTAFCCGSKYLPSGTGWTVGKNRDFIESEVKRAFLSDLRCRRSLARILMKKFWLYTAAILQALQAVGCATPAYAGTDLGGTGNTSAGVGAIAGGNSNSANGEYSVVIGTSNTSNSTDSAVIGKENIVNTFYSMVYGTDNQVGTAATVGSDVISVDITGNFVFGNANSIGSASESNLIIGSGSSINGGNTSSIALNNIIIGNRASITGGGITSNTAMNGAIAIGDKTSITGNAGIVIGDDSHVEADNTLAIGHETNANEVDAVAIGYRAGAYGKDSVAIGSNASSEMESSLAIGNEAVAKNENSIALGEGAVSYEKEAFAIGVASEAKAEGSFAMGNAAVTTGDNALAIGYMAKSHGQSAYALGDNTNAYGQYDISFGFKAVTGINGNSDSEFNIAIGQNSKAIGSGGRSLAVGSAASANGTSATAIGDKAKAQTTQSVALGASSSATGSQAVAIGYNSKASGTSSISIGTGNTVTGNNSGAIGDPSVVDSASSYIVGNNSQIGTGTAATLSAQDAAGNFGLGNAISIGTASTGNLVMGNGASVNAGDATSAGTNSIVIGKTASVTGSIDSAIAIGTGASATANNAVAIGTGSIADTANTVSVGNSTTQRKIVNVAAGTLSATSTDAVNGSQLYATNQNVANLQAAMSSITTGGIDYDDATKASVTFAGTGGTALKNVAAGTLSATSTDAVNGSQLYATNQNVATNATNIASNAADIADLQAADALNVKYDSLTKNTVYLGGASGTQIKNLAAGTDGTDAVNLNQLNAAIAGVTAGVDPLAIHYDDTTHKKVTLDGDGGTVLDGVAPGTLSANSKEAVNGSQLYTTNLQVAANASDIAELQASDALSVKYDSREKDTVTLGGTSGTKITNLKAGNISSSSTDAVNGSQLYEEQEARKAADEELSSRIGTLDPDADYTYINAGNNVSENLENLDAAVSDAMKQASIVQDNGRTITIGKDSATPIIDVGHTSDGKYQPRIITGVATDPSDGSSAANVDYVNRKVAGMNSRINSVGANAAALAGIHSAGYDIDKKAEVALAVGNYKDKTAAAIGLFYHPNNDVIISAASTLSSENMVNAGVTWKFGKKGDGISGRQKESEKIRNMSNKVEDVATKYERLAAENHEMKGRLMEMQMKLESLMSRFGENS